MKYVIIEDSRLARRELAQLLKDFPDLESVGEAADGEMAVELIQQYSPDLIFLDIQLPGKNGFEVLDALQEVPKVIFTTAFHEYAIRSFEYNTIDYLVKPIQKAHLKRAIEKVRQVSEVADILKAEHRVFIKDQEKSWLVQVKEIRLLESYGNYTRLYFRIKPMILRSLSYLEAILDPRLFIRISRQQMVNINQIQSIQPLPNGCLLLQLENNQELKVSRRQTKRIRELFSL